MSEEPVKIESHKTPTRQGLYAKAAKYAPEALEKIVWLMRNSHNQSIVISAANKILDKAIPDLKSTEVSGNNGEDLKLIVKIVSEATPTE